MTPDATNPGADRPPDEDDLGPPVVELRDVSWPLGDRFPEKVHRRIERRLLSGELLELFWTAPAMMVLEFLRLPFDLLSGRRK